MHRKVYKRVSVTVSHQ